MNKLNNGVTPDWLRDSRVSKEDPLGVIKPERASYLDGITNELECEVGNLGMALQVLRGKVEGVLTPLGEVPRDPVTAGELPQKLQRLRSLVGALSCQINDLREITNHLEV